MNAKQAVKVTLTCSNATVDKRSLHWESSSCSCAATFASSLTSESVPCTWTDGFRILLRRERDGRKVIKYLQITNIKLRADLFRYTPNISWFKSKRLFGSIPHHNGDVNRHLVHAGFCLGTSFFCVLIRKCLGDFLFHTYCWVQTNWQSIRLGKHSAIRRYLGHTNSSLANG